MIKQLTTPPTIDLSRGNGLVPTNGYRWLADGSMFVANRYSSTFRSLGWDHPQAVMDDPRPIVRRVVAHRDNCHLDVTDEAGNPVRLFLKRHHEPILRWRFPLTEPAISGWQEAMSAFRCQQAGVPTLEVVAAGRVFDHAARRWDSFFVSAEVPGEPADDFWSKHLVNASQEERFRFLEVLAETIRRLHAGNLFHRDLYWCHFYVSRNQSGEYSARLIDLQRILHSQLLRVRWQLKDLGQFVFSAPAGLVSTEELEFWYRSYRQVGSVSGIDRFAWHLIKIRGMLYRWKEGS